jgi:signal transduction histidine kinase
LAKVHNLKEAEDWAFRHNGTVRLHPELLNLQSLAAELPKHLQRKMEELKGNVRGKYHALIALTGTASILSVSLLVCLLKFFYDGVVRPLQTVIHGSRRVASGDFEFRVELQTHDEMAELAAALNAMTSRFKEIRDDLDRQVRERTKEVVRGEQLASVGFLAAGVAHEINNPLQAIAMCAESLESRLHDIIAADDAEPDDSHNSEITVLRKYLRRIQDEAFRCKGITEKLLSYSRLGDAEKQDTDLTAVITDVIDLIRTIRAYRGKRIEFTPTGPQFARVVPHEIKQIVLNLITNALDSLELDGLVRVELRPCGEHVEVIVRDNGCGMSEEVKKHLFEPFFTRRRDGQGTGLGLSITYRIVQDHGGSIIASSDGPGRGSSFRITLPLNRHEERHEKLQAA